MMALRHLASALQESTERASPIRKKQQNIFKLKKKQNWYHCSVLVGRFVARCRFRSVWVKPTGSACPLPLADGVCRVSKRGQTSRCFVEGLNVPKNTPASMQFRHQQL